MTPGNREATIESGAEFSDCRTYRYALWRHWSDNPRVAFIGLNPSTADETEDDPTIRRCIRFAKDWGYGSLVMLNAYAFRATDPIEMKRALQLGVDVLGKGNRAAISRHAFHCEMIVAAWGAHCSAYRDDQIKQDLMREIHCLGVVKNGRPKHPLYIAAATKPQLYWKPV